LVACCSHEAQAKKMIPVASMSLSFIGASFHIR
jgi:hypothetical protein